MEGLLGALCISVGISVLFSGELFLDMYCRSDLSRCCWVHLRIVLTAYLGSNKLQRPGMRGP